MIWDPTASLDAGIDVNLFFFWLGCVDSRNPYAPKSSRFLGRKASRNVLASRSFTPGSPWALGIVMTPRRKASGSNLALGITIVLTRGTYALPFV